MIRQGLKGIIPLSLRCVGTFEARWDETRIANRRSGERSRRCRVLLASSVNSDCLNWSMAAHLQCGDLRVGEISGRLFLAQHQGHQGHLLDAGNQQA
eukprot:s46_g46.t1